MISQLHHLNDDFTLLGVLPRRNDCPLPEQRAPENHIGTALRKPGGTEGHAEGELLLDPIQERREEGGTYRLPWRPTPDAVYAIVAPGTSFVIPPDPNQLVIISGTNSVTLGNLRRNHAEAAREFKEWVNLESAQGKSKSRRQLAKHFSPEYLVVMGIRPSPGEGHRRTPLHGVQTGGKPRPRQKSLEVVGAVGREQTIPGISATGPGNPRVRERRRADNRRRRYCRHSLHARVQHGPDLRRLRQVGRQAT